MNQINVLGAKLHPIQVDELNGLIRNAVLGGNRIIIAGHNLHGISIHRSDVKRREFCDLATIVRIDGMAILFWAKALGYPLQRTQRVTYMDWLYPLMADSKAEGWRVFYLGGKHGVASRAAELLREKYPGLVIETRNGYFGAGENDAVLEKIAVFQPHVLMVGMGMPKQEHWVLDNLENLNANAILTCGACFDYVAGAIPAPPRWMGKAGLEWLYRLVSEPRRLWHRYLLEPWGLIPLFLKDLAAIKEHRRRARRLMENEGLPSVRTRSQNRQ